MSKSIFLQQKIKLKNTTQQKSKFITLHNMAIVNRVTMCKLPLRQMKTTNQTTNDDENDDDQQ